MYFEKSIIYLLLFIIIFNLNLNDIINKKSINNLFRRLLFSNFTKKYITTDKVNYTDKSKNIKNNNLNKDTIKSIFNNNLNKGKCTDKNKYTNTCTDTDTDTDTDSDILTVKSIFNNNLNNSKIVLYKHKEKSKYLLNDIYDNFFNNKKYKIDDTSIDKNLINIETSNNIILNDTQNNILLNKIDNFIIYNFQSKKNVYYKIKCKCKLKTNNLKNIKLIISNNKKRFMYNSTEHNCINQIYEYGFILDYNIFDTDDIIYIYLLFYNDENKDFLIDSIFIEVIENTLIQKNNSIIIFNVNNKYNPLYLNTQNILEYLELKEESSIFFI